MFKLGVAQHEQAHLHGCFIFVISASVAETTYFTFKNSYQNQVQMHIAINWKIFFFFFLVILHSWHMVEDVDSYPEGQNLWHSKRHPSDWLGFALSKTHIRTHLPINTSGWFAGHCWYYCSVPGALVLSPGSTSWPVRFFCTPSNLLGRGLPEAVEDLWSPRGLGLNPAAFHQEDSFWKQ